MGPTRKIQEIRKEFACIGAFKGPCPGWGPVRVGAHMGPYGLLWALMGPYEPLWALMGPYGPDFVLKIINSNKKS